MTTSDANCAFGRGALQSLTIVSTDLPRTTPRSPMPFNRALSFPAQFPPAP
jgi:hypothetical protein